MADIFLSYSREDQATARHFAEGLEAQGYSVWWDVTLRSGEAYDQVTEDALKNAKAVVVLWSKASVASRWVRAEATQAARNKMLLPAMIESCERPIMFELTQTAELSHWDGSPTDQMWLSFVADVKRFVEKKGTSGASVTQAPVAVSRPAAAASKSICVLPFENMSGDADQAYFSDGITEDIITDLSKVSALSVVARNMAFTFKNKSMGVTEIARHLQVSHVLDGSVRKAGGRVRITAQLNDGATGTYVWAERFDRDLKDIFALQDEISKAIVDALKLKLLPEEKKAIERRGTNNADAYNLYLMARQEYVGGVLTDSRWAMTIIRLCQRATELDPDYAGAWSLMSAGQSGMRLGGGTGNVGDGGRAAAERAIALDPNLAEAHAVMANVLLLASQTDAAAKEVELALQLDPESIDANWVAGLVKCSQRHPEDAIPHLEKATRLLEVDYQIPAFLASCYWAIGDRTSAKSVAKIQLDRCERTLALAPNNGWAMMTAAHALSTLGDQERSRDLIKRSLLLDPDNIVIRLVEAIITLRLDGKEAALEALDKFVPMAPPAMLSNLKFTPGMYGLFDDPRYQTMIADAEAQRAKEVKIKQASRG